MRVEPYRSGSVIHVVKRGARGMEIVRDTRDRKRFLESLYFLNDKYKDDYWTREIAELPPFSRPKSWPTRSPLVDILAWTLLNNHMHLLLHVRDNQENDVSLFLQKLFRSMTGYFNEKYNEKGSIFQGPYKSKTVDTDEYLRYVIPYIMVKNTLETHPAGFDVAAKNFESSWKWAAQYPYSSLCIYAGVEMGETVSPIVSAENNIVRDIFQTPQQLKEASRDMLEAYRDRHDDLRGLQLEE